jgi:hypothetical protein
MSKAYISTEKIVTVHGMPKWGDLRTCGALLSAFADFFELRPVGISEAVCGRYAKLIGAFSTFVCVGESFSNNSKFTSVCDLPLGAMKHASREWVMSLFDGSGSRLQPHLALDLLSTLDQLASGSCHTKDGERIAALFGELNLIRELFPIHDRRFKKEFTEEIDLVVAAKLPNKVRARLHQTEAEPDWEFLAKVTRCHLSQHISSIYERAIIFENTDPLDSVGEFELQSHLVTDENGSLCDHPQITVNFPVSWVTHEFVWHQSERSGRFVPVL